jgi:hypothetical protein
MGEKRNAYRILMRNLVVKRPLGRPRYGYNSKIDVRQIGWGGMDWIDLIQGRDWWKCWEIL